MPSMLERSDRSSLQTAKTERESGEIGANQLWIAQAILLEVGADRFCLLAPLDPLQNTDIDVRADAVTAVNRCGHQQRSCAGKTVPHDGSRPRKHLVRHEEGELRTGRCWTDVLATLQIVVLVDGSLTAGDETAEIHLLWN